MTLADIVRAFRLMVISCPEAANWEVTERDGTPIWEVALNKTDKTVEVK